MHGEASVKVEGGKLVRVETTYSDVFEDVTITGDFFLEPPEALEDIEAAIEGESIDADDEALIGKIEAVDAELIGFEPSHIVEALREVTA
jgi:lipoate-protein ligase A